MGGLDRPHRRVSACVVEGRGAAEPRACDFWRTVATRTRGARDCINLGLASVARVSE